MDTSVEEAVEPNDENDDTSVTPTQAAVHTKLKDIGDPVPKEDVDAALAKINTSALTKSISLLYMRKFDGAPCSVFNAEGDGLFMSLPKPGEDGKMDDTNIDLIPISDYNADMVKLYTADDNDFIVIATNVLAKSMEVIKMNGGTMDTWTIMDVPAVTRVCPTKDSKQLYVVAKMSETISHLYSITFNDDKTIDPVRSEKAVQLNEEDMVEFYTLANIEFKNGIFMTAIMKLKGSEITTKDGSEAPDSNIMMIINEDFTTHVVNLDDPKSPFSDIKKHLGIDQDNSTE